VPAENSRNGVVIQARFTGGRPWPEPARISLYYPC
jgi:hypothetical protein